MNVRKHYQSHETKKDKEITGTIMIHKLDNLMIQIKSTKKLTCQNAYKETE